MIGKEPWIFLDHRTWLSRQVVRVMMPADRWLNARPRNVWIAGGVGFLLFFLAGLASAQTRDVRLVWLESMTPGGPATEYVLYARRGATEQRIELGPGTGTAGCPLLTATVGFLRAGAYTVQLAAVGPGGESARSKPMAVASCRAAGAPGCGP